VGETLSIICGRVTDPAIPLEEIAISLRRVQEMQYSNTLHPLPGKLYYQGSVLFLATYGDPRVLDAELANAQEAADLVAELGSDAWVYISVPDNRPKRKTMK
jgi:hypothetical protein